MFQVQHVTLKRGERMVLPIVEFPLDYQDVFTLELPYGPPPEVRANLNTEQQRELVRYIFSSHNHFDANQLIDAVKREGFRATRATVYRTLNKLVDAGMVTKGDGKSGKYTAVVAVISQSQPFDDCTPNSHCHQQSPLKGDDCMLLPWQESRKNAEVVRPAESFTDQAERRGGVRSRNRDYIDSTMSGTGRGGI